MLNNTISFESWIECRAISEYDICSLVPIKAGGRQCGLIITIATGRDADHPNGTGQIQITFWFNSEEQQIKAIKQICEE